MKANDIKKSKIHIKIKGWHTI